MSADIQTYKEEMVMKKLQILGSGCAKCKKLADETEKAAKELSLDYELTKVTEMEKIISFGVMSTPALVVDGMVKVSGRIPDLDELKKMIS
jgi:small redox-active disulfide protein 2